MYAIGNNIYCRLKIGGNVKYLKCSKVGCDGSAKLVEDVM